MPVEHEHASVSLKVILLIFAVILVGVLAYFVWDFKTTPDTADNSTQPVATSTSTTKTYTDTENGFSFGYSNTLTIASSSDDKSDTGDKITVKIYNLETMEDEPLGYDKNSLTALRDDLTSGKVATAIEGMFAKDTIILARLEICDVQFTRILDIFDGNTLVSISLVLGSDNEAKVISEDTAYFVSDTENCSSEKRFEDSDQYRADLLAGKTGATSKQWLDDFRTIVNSFKLTN